MSDNSERLAKARAFIRHKMKKLKAEGYKRSQRIAIALNMARRRGYRV